MATAVKDCCAGRPLVAPLRTAQWAPPSTDLSSPWLVPTYSVGPVLCAVVGSRVRPVGSVLDCVPFSKLHVAPPSPLFHTPAASGWPVGTVA